MVLCQGPLRETKHNLVVQTSAAPMCTDMYTDSETTLVYPVAARLYHQAVLSLAPGALT